MNATYMECSAKEQIGVEDIFDRAICTVVDREEQEKAFMRGDSQPRMTTGRAQVIDSGGMNNDLSGGRPGKVNSRTSKRSGGRKRDLKGSCTIL